MMKEFKEFLDEAKHAKNVIKEEDDKKKEDDDSEDDSEDKKEKDLDEGKEKKEDDDSDDSDEDEKKEDLKEKGEGDDKEYEAIVRKLLKKHGYKDIASIPKDKKDDFFDELDSLHVSDDEEDGIEESKPMKGFDEFVNENSQLDEASIDALKKRASKALDKISENISKGRNTLEKMFDKGDKSFDEALRKASNELEKSSNIILNTRDFL